MIPPVKHIADEMLSAASDEQLTPDEAREVNAHLATCLVCRARLDELQSVIGLLRALPTLEVPRDFSIGPRIVVDPPNVVRLRRWYSVARAGAASLAAAFVFLSAGALYVDSKPVATSVGQSAQPKGNAGSVFAVPAASPAVETAPGPTSAPPIRALAPAAPAPVPPRSAVPGDAGAAAPAGAAAARAQPASTPSADQVSAATSVRALPTLVPTLAPVPTPAPPEVAPPVASSGVDPAAPLRAGAASVGILAALGLLATLVIRHRLRAASISTTTE